MKGKYASEIEIGDAVKLLHYGRPATGVVKEIQPSQKTGHKKITFMIGGVTEPLIVPDTEWFDLTEGEE